MLAVFQQEHRLLEMQGVRRGDVRGVESIAAGGLFQRGERQRNAVFAGKIRRRLFPAGKYRRMFEARVEVRPLKKEIGNGARAYCEKTYFAAHKARWYIS